MDNMRVEKSGCGRAAKKGQKVRREGDERERGIIKIGMGREEKGRKKREEEQREGRNKGRKIEGKMKRWKE